MQVLTTDEAALQQLTDPLVRDLGWACFSQAMLVSAESDDSGLLGSDLESLFLLTPQRLQALQSLDQTPRELHDFLTAKTGRRRLGIYFEHLIEFFLSNDPGMDLLVRNLPVRDENRTLGEFDFIYRDHSSGGQVIHLEIALKFYMGLADSMQPQPDRRWLGPGSQDALEDKIDKMLTQQSKLASSPYGHKALQNNGTPLPQVQRVVIAGELFVPSETVSPPTQCLPRHHRGDWIRLAVLPDHIRDWQKTTLLSKSDWLAPLADGFLSKHGTSKQTLQQHIAEHFKQSQFPVMIEGIDELGKPLPRTFVVPPSWPGNSAR